MVVNCKEICKTVDCRGCIDYNKFVMKEENPIVMKIFEKGYKIGYNKGLEDGKDSVFRQL